MNNQKTTCFLIAATALFALLVAAVAANAGVTADISLTRPVILRDEAQSVFALIRLRADDARPGGERQRPPLALSLVIDRSGSMQAQGKLAYAKAAARDIVSRLSPRDSLAIVEYDNRVTVARPMARVTNRRAIRRVIDSLNPRGGTNLAGGMMAGVSQMMDPKIDPEAVRRVILLSDGLANSGVTDPRAIAAMAADARSRGVTISTMGLGLSYNEDLMQRIADAGNGQYYYIESATQIAEIFGQEMDRLFSTVTRDMKLTMALGRHVTGAQIYGYPAVQDDRRITVSLNDFYAGEERSLLIRFDLEPASTPSVTLGALAVTYTDLVRNRPATEGRPITVRTSTDRALVERSEDRAVSVEAILITADQAHEDSLRLYERGDVSRAKEQMATLQTKLSRDAARYDDVKLNKKLEALRMESRDIDRARQDARYRQHYLKKSKQALHQAKQGQRGKYLLMEGAASPDVRRLQQHLKQSGHYAGPVDGQYTPELAEAVKRYQQDRHIQADGVAGPATLRALGLY